MTAESVSREISGRKPPGVPSSGSPLKVEVRLLGGFELRVKNQLVPLPSSSQRLVALLALRGRAHRSRIAGSLWPETPEPRAMASLRTAIYRANRLGPEIVVCNRHSADLTPDARVDCRQLTRLARMLQGEQASLGTYSLTSPGEIRDEILLPDWDDEWLEAERERLYQMQVHLLESQADQLLCGGHFGMALDCALAATRMDPLRESAHRAIIRIHLAEGNIAEARRAFRRYSELLHRELGVMPTTLTSELLS